MLYQDSPTPNTSTHQPDLPTSHIHPALHHLLCWLSTILLVVGCCWMIPHGDFRDVGTVPQFWIGSTIMSIGFLLSWQLQSISARWFWGVAIATRLLLLLMYPGDDMWRYLWEGHLQTLDISPYHFAPEAPELVPYHTHWWSLINHRDTSAIYPPVTQWGFRFLAMITPSVWLFKLAFSLADLGMCWGLSRRFGYQRTLLYAWNPLVLYSFAGGGHYDSWFMLPLITAWLVFDRVDPVDRKQWGLSAVLIGISIAVKWISLPVLGFLLWQALHEPSDRERNHERNREQNHERNGILTIVPHLSFPKPCQKPWLRRWGIILLGGILPLLIAAIPFCTIESCPLVPVSSGFVAYGRSAEFVPHFVQLVWPASLKENWIYALPLGLSVLWLLVRSPTFLQFVESYFTFLLLLSPVIHSWYFTWLIPFAVASRNLGTRLVSMSAFIYFVLQHRFALDEPWLLKPVERIVLWCPFILGWLWTVWKNEITPREDFLNSTHTRIQAHHEIHVSYLNLRENSENPGPQHGSIR